MTRHTTHFAGCDCYIHKKVFQDKLSEEYGRLEALCTSISGDRFLPDGSKRAYINFIAGIQARLFELQEVR